MILNTFLDEHYFPYKPSVSGRTIGLYRYSVRKYGQWLGKIPTLDDLTNANIGKYLRDLLTANDLAPSSVDKERRQLNAIWRHAHTLGMTSRGPLVQPLKIPEVIPTALTVPELKQLRLAFDSLRGSTGGIPNSDFLRAAFAVQFSTAERIGAVIRLKWQDVTGDVITFNAATRKGGRKSMIKRVPGWVLDDLAKIREPKRDRVFPIEETNQTKIQLLYRRLFAAAGVSRPKGKSSHLLRSTHATLVHLAGGDAARSLGHASPTTTHRHYIDGRHDPGDQADFLPEL